MKKKSIAEHAVDVLMDMRKEYGEPFSTVAWGDLCVLHEISNRSGIKLKNMHPSNVHQAVLNGLDRRPDIWEKFFYIVHAGKNCSDRLVRCYKLRSDYDIPRD